MEESNKIRNDNGLLEAGPSVLPENAAADEESIIYSDNEDYFTSAQRERSPDLLKGRQDERPRKFKSPMKRKRFNPRDDEETLPRKKPRQYQYDTSTEIKERIRKSEELIAKLKAHTEKGTCPKTLRYGARASIAPDEDFKKIYLLYP